MKISAQDEYGLRILLQIAKADHEDGLNLSQISELEQISLPYAAKITRALRMAGFIQSMRGHKGGYTLAMTPDAMKVSAVLKSLGGSFYDEKFCAQHTGTLSLCTNSVDCSLRSLWTILQINMDRLLDQITIRDLMNSEKQVNSNLLSLTQEMEMR